MGGSNNFFQLFKNKAKKFLPNKVKGFVKDKLREFQSEEIGVKDGGEIFGNHIEIDGIVFKRLSSVETDKKKSNQHEFNGSNYLKELLGKTEPKEFQVTFAWIGSPDKILSEKGSVTWYDARRSHPSRSEYRLYFKDNIISKNFSVNDPLFIIKRGNRSLLLISTKAYSTAERQLLYLFALENISFDNNKNKKDVFQKGEIVDFEFKSRAIDKYIINLFKLNSDFEGQKQSLIEDLEDDEIGVDSLINQYKKIEEPEALAEEIEEEIEEEPEALAEEKEIFKKQNKNINWKDQLMRIKENIEAPKVDASKTESIFLDETSQIKEEASKIVENYNEQDLEFLTDISSVEKETSEEIKIDSSQKEFLKLIESNNVICVSPPGHGKTSTAIESISYYLDFSDFTKPKNIFFLSFTNAAINEARNRLKDVKGGRLVECYTIDSFAGRLNQLVRENTGLKFQTNTYEENMIAAAKFVKGEADKDSRKCVQGFIDRTIDLLIIDEAQDINNFRFDFIRSVLGRLNEAARVIVFGDPLQEIYSFQEQTSIEGTLLKYLLEEKTHFKFKKHELKINHRIKNSSLLKTYSYARKNYEDKSISMSAKNKNLKIHLNDLYSSSDSKNNDKNSNSKVFLFRRNIDVVSHVLPRYKNRIQTSFRIGFLHEIINPFFAFIYKYFPDSEKLSLDDLWRVIFELNEDIIEKRFKFNIGNFIDLIDNYFGSQNSFIDLKQIEDDIRFRQFPQIFRSEKWGNGEDVFSSMHSFKGRESENIVLHMQSNGSSRLNADEYRIYYVGLTRAISNLEYCEFYSEKIDYKKFLNRREFIPSSKGVFIGRKGDIIWSNESNPYKSDMAQDWFSRHPNNIVELEIIYNDSNFKEPTFDIVTKKKCIYIGSLSKSLSDSLRYLFSSDMPPRFGNIFMVGTTTGLIEDFLPREEDSTNFKEIIKYIKTKPKVIFYPNVVGILKPRF